MKKLAMLAGMVICASGCSLNGPAESKSRQGEIGSGGNQAGGGMSTASLVFFDDAISFLAATSSVLTVDFPATGSQGNAYSENGVTIQQVDGRSLGVVSRSPETPGNELVVSGPESINITLPQPETIFGMYIEDSTLDPSSPSVCPKLDSSFTFTFLSGGAGGSVVDVVNVAPPSDRQYFVGVVASAPFDRVEVREDGAQPGENTGAHCENDYFGDMYLGGSYDPGCDQTGDPGDWHYCSTACPCEDGEGDCDNDSECVDGTICVKGGIGAQFGYDPDVDICLATCHRSPLGGSNYCSPDCPCDEGEGDCDGDDECAPGLACANNVGGDYGYDPDTDVCVPSCEANAPGDSDYCSEECPCDEGLGDCDNDSECAGDLRCAKNVGDQFGFDASTDICVSECSRIDMEVGDWHYCSESCPCEARQGDCDTDAECADGLTCVKGDIGSEFGWDEDVDVCLNPACEAEDGWSISQSGVYLGSISPILSDQNIVDYYAYGQIDAASYNAHHFDSDAFVPESGTSQVFLHRDLATDIVSLVLVHDQANDGSGGQVDVDISGLPADAVVSVADDPGEASSPNAGTMLMSWSWIACCTDGVAISASAWNSCVTVDASFVNGISRWVTAGGTCGAAPIDLDLNQPVEICPL